VLSQRDVVSGYFLAFGIQPASGRHRMLHRSIILTLAIGSTLAFAGPALSAEGLAAGSVVRDCDTCPELVVVPKGEFTMGATADDPSRDDDEGPQRVVAFARPFAIGKYEVTFDEWDACVADRACEQTGDEGWGRGRRPVINVTFAQVQAYLQWLSGKTGKSYRLPAEAEWEYAARGGSAGPRFWGAPERACEFANVYDRTARAKYLFDWDSFPCEDKYTETAPVGSFAPNGFGLHDVLGNVFEWVADCYRPTYAGAPIDGSAVLQEGCLKQLSRGGSWNIFPAWVRASYRYGLAAALHSNNLGFRVARALD
jgi:formylglycine-generating enzyme required for sulfatase activity